MNKILFKIKKLTSNLVSFFLLVAFLYLLQLSELPL